MSPSVSRLELVPVFDLLFALLPAPEYFFPVQLPIEVDEPRLEPLEHAADPLELEQEIVDLARDVLDTTAQRELLGRLAPFGPGLRGDELVLRDQIAPVRMERDEIGYDPLYKRQGTVRFSEREVFARHGTNLDAQTRRRTGENRRE